MIPRAILPLLCAAALTLAPVPGFARVGVVVGLAPPAPVVEVAPAPPAPGYVWQPGYWSWNGFQYVWVPGVCRASLCSRGMGARKLGPARWRLGVGPWPLAALAAVRSVEARLGRRRRILRSTARANQGWPPAPSPRLTLLKRSRRALH
jgi:hypothetical protein